MMQNIFDADFNGPGSEMYRSELAPDLFPHQKQMRLENWSQDDLEMYVGGVFTPGYGIRKYDEKLAAAHERIYG